MATIQGDHRRRPERRSIVPRSPGEVRHPLDEPPLFRSREDRLHDGMLVGILALMLIGAAVGLLTTLVDLLTLLD